MKSQLEGGGTRSVRRGRGCLFWGSLSLFLLLILIGGLCYYIYRMLDPYLSPAPVDVRHYRLKPGEYQTLEKRLDGFLQAAEAGAPLEMVLTADDLNAFIAGNRELEDLVGKVFVRVEDSAVFLDVSIPLKEMPVYSDRYFNGTLGLTLGLEEGRLTAYVDSAVANDKPFPFAILKAIRGENLFRRLHNPAVERFIQHAKTLEVRDGKVLLRR